MKQAETSVQHDTLSIQKHGHYSQHGWQCIDAATSVQGRPIELYWPQTHVNANTPPTPLDTLIFAAIHGDEIESLTVLNEWAIHVGLNKPPLPHVGIIPVLNPDGLAAGTRKNANQIDINRNFPTANWAKTDDSSAHYFGGFEAASEPETQFLMRIIETYTPQKIISLHTPYRVINYDGPALALAQAMASKNGYDVVADIGYPTPGSFGNYAGIERGIPVITLELPEGDAFTDAECKNNIAALNTVIMFQG